VRVEVKSVVGSKGKPGGGEELESVRGSVLELAEVNVQWMY
jgi:hypothetical protein